jgi:protein-S-isoprenylcysteine O-methyltransferase Ste14
MKLKRKIRNIGLILLGTVIFLAVLFVAAGSMLWVNAWVLTGIILAGFVVGVVSVDPSLLQERVGIKSGVKREDIFFSVMMGRLGPLSTYIIAGLDFRFGWSASFPLALVVAGFVSYIIGFAILLWATKENKFFSSVVRIQKERGHYVITNGPYRLVRHPGYLGSIIYMLGLPFALASYWAIIPAIATNIIAVIRTFLEDRILRRELEGYTTYVDQVKYRLLPGVW